MTLTYTIISTDLGQVLIAASERGLRAVEFRSSTVGLEAKLAAGYPDATRLRDDEGLAGWGGQIQRHLAGDQPSLDLPVDVPATPLQGLVWEALRAIPYGVTRSYGQIARELGSGITAKEVGEACAANPVALVIPCHRVVRADGSLAGYRWGVHRKRRLLEQEAAGTATAPAPPSPVARQARLAAV